MSIEFHPIGVIHTPFTEPKGMPIQPAGAAGVRGTVEVFEEFRDGFAPTSMAFRTWSSSITST